MEHAASLSGASSGEAMQPPVDSAAYKEGRRLVAAPRKGVKAEEGSSIARMHSFRASNDLLISAPSLRVCLSCACECECASV